MARLCVDYTPLEPNVWQWATVKEFVHGNPHEGVHQINLGAGGLSLDLQLLNWQPDVLQQQDVLPVFFSAAVGARNGRDAPFFSGGGLAAADGYAAIALSDPSLALAPGLSLAWYTGSADAPAQAVIKDLLERMADAFGKELLLVGGSGGGFAACLYASLLGTIASAFTWNPQTDILKYYRPAVREYLRTCWGSSEIEEDRARALLTSQGVLGEIAAAGPSAAGPSRWLYMQNVNDTFHLERHALPFLSGMAMRSTGLDGLHISKDGRLAALFGVWSDGHEAPPKTMIRAIIRKLMNPAASAMTVGRWIVSSPFTGQVKEGALPLQFGPETTLDVDAFQSDAGIETTAQLTGISVSFRSRYAFYLLNQESRVDTRWYEGEMSASFDDRETGGAAYTVVAFSRDDFGNIIQATTPVRADRHEALSLPESSRVFILGSCVSRDTFALFDLDDRLAGYVARTSLASAMHADRPPGVREDLAGIASSFQRRMVGIDLRKELTRILAQTEFDVLLLDLIDERFSIGLAGSAPFTISPEFLSLTNAPDATSRLLPDDEARWIRWCEGVDALMAHVGPDRVVLNQAYWATHLDDGTKLANPDRTQSMNRLLRLMYEHIAREYGIRTICYPKQVLIGSRVRKWGVSPFHYADGFYKHTLAELRKLLA